MLRIDAISKQLGSAIVLKDVSLCLAPGETGLLTGPSGTGKTTLLRLIAGLDHPDNGEIRYGETVWFSAQRWTPPWERRLGMVFQDLVLWPHMTVREHLDFVLHQAHPRMSRQERKQRTHALLAEVGLDGMDGRLPAEMSGGQQQRLALLRAIASAPQMLLLDEAFSHLDEALQADLWTWLLAQQYQQGWALLCVSHQPSRLNGEVIRRFEISHKRLVESQSLLQVHEEQVRG